MRNFKYLKVVFYMDNLENKKTCFQCKYFKHLDFDTGWCDFHDVEVFVWYFTCAYFNEVI